MDNDTTARDNILAMPLALEIINRGDARTLPVIGRGLPHWLRPNREPRSDYLREADLSAIMPSIGQSAAVQSIPAEALPYRVTPMLAAQAASLFFTIGSLLSEVIYRRIGWNELSFHFCHPFACVKRIYQQLCRRFISSTLISFRFVWIGRQQQHFPVTPELAE